MEKTSHLSIIIKIIAIFRFCTIECKILNKNVNHIGFITHLGNNFHPFRLRNTVITNPPFDPGGVCTTDEHLEDLKNVFLFNVAHKLKEGHKLLDVFTVPINKQKLANEHFNMYFGDNYSVKAKQLGNIIDDFEYNKYEVEETVDKIRDVFLTEITDRFKYMENISDLQVLNRQVDLLYGADLMASYVLLFSDKKVRSVLYKYIWNNYAFLDSKKEYLCCNWIVNGGVHDLELHKKFSLDELTNEDLVNIIRLHKKYLSFVKVKSRKVLNTLDRNSLISIFQTILMKSIWAHYIHEPSNLSIRNVDEESKGDGNKGIDRKIKDSIIEEHNKNNKEKEVERKIDNKVSVKEYEEDELNQEIINSELYGTNYSVDEDEEYNGGYLDNIYLWMTKYKNKIGGKDKIKKGDYVNNPEVNQLNNTLNSLEKLLSDTIKESKGKRYSKLQRKKYGEILNQKSIERTELKQSLRELIEYYKENIKNMKGIYGRIKKEENIEFINNLVDYDKSDLLTLVVTYLSALPELKQITDNQVYLNYLTLKKMTLVKLLYLSMIRTSPVFVPIINHYYRRIENEENESEDNKEKEDIIREERLEIIRKYNELKDKDNKKEDLEESELEKLEQDKKIKGKEKEDILIFEVDELNNLVDTNINNNKILRKKKMKINNEIKEIIIIGTERNDEVMRSILRHPPHFKILLKLLNKNEYSNEVIKENIEYLNNNNEDDKNIIEEQGKDNIKNDNIDKQRKEQEINKIIKNKKVEVILSLMNKEELENIYKEFLQYIYPFNSLYKDSINKGHEEINEYNIGYEEEDEENMSKDNIDKEIKNNKKDEMENEELLGDENIDIIHDNRLLTMIKENMSGKKIMEILDKYAMSISKDKEGSIRNKMISFLSSKFDIFNNKEDKDNTENKEYKKEGLPKKLEQDKNLLELLEMKDEELDNEIDKYVEELERDPNTLRIKVNNTPIRYRSRKENVFNILPPLRDEKVENEYRTFKLNSISDENITFMVDNEKENLKDEELLGDENIEIKNKEEEKNNVRLDRFENLIENNKRDEDEEYNNRYGRSLIKRNRENKYRRGWINIKGEYKQNKVEKMEFDKKDLESWMRLGLSSSMANTAMSYLTSVYRNNSSKKSKEDKERLDRFEDRNIRKEKMKDSIKEEHNKNKQRKDKEMTQEYNRQIYFGKEIQMRPTLIQMLGAPEILKKKNKKNLIICGGVGSGKTLSYLLPIIQNLKEDEKSKLRVASSPRCLIVVPTTELCDQICKTVKDLGHLAKVSTVAMCKGRERSKIREKMKGLVDVLITTPSRLHRYRKYFKLNRLKYLVIEEADCLLNEGFFPKIYSILQQLPNYGSSGKGINEESLNRRGIEGDLPVQIIQVASTINYLKFFETIHKSFNKFINKQNIINERHTKSSKKENNKTNKWIQLTKEKENIEYNNNEEDRNIIEVKDKDNIKNNKIEKIKELINEYNEEKRKREEGNIENKDVFKVNLMKLFGKHKIRLELYRHILEYYFAPLDKNQNSFKYDRRIIEDLVNSYKIIDEIGITRPSKGIKHMFIPGGQDKVRTLINLLKYDLKYPTSNNSSNKRNSNIDKYMRKYNKEDRLEKEVGYNKEIKILDKEKDYLEQQIQIQNNKDNEDIQYEDRKIIIFCKTVKAVRAVDHYLTESSYEPISIHSEMPFIMRKRNFERFNKSRTGILVTTELLSRGLDLKVDNVILFDFPRNPNEYIRKSSLLRHLPAYVISECELGNTKNSINKGNEEINEYNIGYEEEDEDYLGDDKQEREFLELLEMKNEELDRKMKINNEIKEEMEYTLRENKEIKGKQKEDDKIEDVRANLWYLNNLGIENNETRLEWEKRRKKICISLIDKRDVVLSEAIKRSLRVEYFPLNKLSSRKKDYNQITGRFKYLTQAGGYYKFLNYIRELQIKDIYEPLDLYKYLDEFRKIIKEQFVNSFKKVKLRRIRICKKRRELMRKLKMLKRWNKAVRLKQRIISDIDKKKREKDYIYVNLTKDQRSCPPIKDLKKVRYELLKLKLLEGSNSEKLLKRSENQILKFINKLQNKLVEQNHLISKLVEKYEINNEVKDNTENKEYKKEGLGNLELEGANYLRLIDKVKDKLEFIRSDNKNKEVRRICSLV